MRLGRSGNNLCKKNLVGVSKSQMNSVDVLYMNTENRWLVNLGRNQNSLVVVERLSFCKTAGHAYHN